MEPPESPESPESRESPPGYSIADHLRAVPPEVNAHISKFVGPCCGTGCVALAPRGAWWNKTLELTGQQTPTCFCCYWDEFRRDAMVSIKTTKVLRGWPEKWPLYALKHTADELIIQWVEGPLWERLLDVNCIIDAPDGQPDRARAMHALKIGTTLRSDFHKLVLHKIENCCKKCCRNSGVEQ